MPIELSTSQRYQRKTNIDTGEENCTVHVTIEVDISVRRVSCDIDATIIAKTLDLRLAGWTAENAIITSQELTVDEPDFDDSDPSDFDDD